MHRGCTKHAGDDVPYGVLTGDTLFVGDVGRPTCSPPAGSRPLAAHDGHRAVRSLHDKGAALPDPTRVFPAQAPARLRQAALAETTRRSASSVDRTTRCSSPTSTSSSPPSRRASRRSRSTYVRRPPHRERHALLDEQAPPLLDIDAVMARHAAGRVLLDPRNPPTSPPASQRRVNIGLQGRFAEWAGDVLSPERDIVLVGDPSRRCASQGPLARVGTTGSSGSSTIWPRCARHVLS